MPFHQKGVEPYEGIEDYIFISYAHNDGEVIFPILRRMQEAGFRFWYDDGIEPGSEWPESIARHLAGSKVCMAFLSKASANSRNCRREINYALSKEKEFLSVVLEHVELTPGLEMQISTYQSIMYDRYQDPEKVVRRLGQMDNLKSCRALQPEGVGNGQSGKRTGINWIENPIPMPAANFTQEEDREKQEQDRRLQEDREKQEEDRRKQEEERIKQEEDRRKEEEDKREEEDRRKEEEDRRKLEAKRAKKEQKNALKKEKKTNKATDVDSDETKPPKKKGKKLLLVIPLLLLAFVLAFAGRSLFRKRLTIGDKTYENDSSYQSIKDAELSAGNLKTLSGFSKCKSLILENCSLPENNTEMLAKMSELTSLQLKDCTGLESLKPLSVLTKLSRLEIVGCSLDDSMLSDFTGSGNIREIDFSRNALTKVPVISGADKVTSLKLAQNSLQDISELSSYTSLSELDLSANDLTDLDSITLPEKLERFFAADNKLSSIAALLNCLRMKNLDIAGNQLENLSALENMTLLENVSLAGNSALTDLSFLKKNAGTMRRLNISGISLEDHEETLDFISVCSGMLALDLSGCSLTRTDFLENLKQLHWLNLADNAIEKLEGISSHKELEFLNLTNNVLTDMTGLPAAEEPGYPGIYWLLHGNRISTLYDNKCGDIAVLDISGNPITEYGAYQRKTIRNFIFEVTEQTELISLKSLDSFRNYYILSIPADRKVAFEDKVSRSGKYTTWEEALEATAGNMLAFTFSR